MAAITDPLVAAGIIFSIVTAVIWLFPRAECETGDMDTKMVCRFLLGPVCLAAIILLLEGTVGHLYLVRWLQL